MPPTTSAVKVEPSQKALDRIALIASLVSPFVQSPVDLARLSFAIVKLGISLQDVDDRFMPAWQAMLRRPLSLLIPGRNFAVAPIRKSWNASLKEVKDAGQLRGREALCDALEKMLEKEDDWSYDAVEDLIGEEPEEPSDPGIKFDEEWQNEFLEELEAWGIESEKLQNDWESGITNLIAELRGH